MFWPKMPTPIKTTIAMVAINKRLGFTVHRHYGTYQIDRQAIGACIARRANSKP